MRVGTPDSRNWIGPGGAPYPNLQVGLFQGMTEHLNL